MGLHRAHRQVQLLRDLSVGVPERDQAQNIDLALGEVVGSTRGGLRGQARTQAGIEVLLAARCPTDGLDELLIGRLLEYVSDRARRQRLPREGGFLLHRQDHYLRCR